MEERFPDKNVYQRFEAAIDRIDSKQRPPSAMRHLTAHRARGA